jgi:hypothetical protein
MCTLSVAWVINSTCSNTGVFLVALGWKSLTAQNGCIEDYYYFFLQSRLALNSLSSWLSLPSARITGIYPMPDHTVLDGVISINFRCYCYSNNGMINTVFSFSLLFYPSELMGYIPQPVLLVNKLFRIWCLSQDIIRKRELIWTGKNEEWWR